MSARASTSYTKSSRYLLAMPGQELRLLTLNGGGVRGLSSLIILDQLIETIDLDSPPKLCDYFNMIGGTSTGGLVVILRVDDEPLC